MSGTITKRVRKSGLLEAMAQMADGFPPEEVAGAALTLASMAVLKGSGNLIEALNNGRSLGDQLLENIRQNWARKLARADTPTS